MTTPRFGFVEWAEGTTQPQTLHNTLALKTDIFLAGGVKSRTTDAQPGSPAEGDCYIITATPSGAAWSGFTQHYIATFYDGAWTEYAPPGRYLTYVDDESALIVWNGATYDAVSVSNPIGDADFAAEGIMRAVDGAGSYTTIKTNLAASIAPTTSNDNTQGYGVYSVWCDTTADEIYFCLDASTAAAVWKQVGSGTGGGITALVKTSNYTANAGEIIGVGSDTAAITITLPATPSANAYVGVWDADDNALTNNITIARNGETIDGVAEDGTINVNGGRFDLIYDGTTWKTPYATPGASTPAGPIIVRKTSDESVISNTTLQNDDELFLAVAPNAVYEFDLNIWFDSSTTADFKYTVTVPTGATLYFSQTGFDAGGANHNDASVTVASGTTRDQFGNGVGTIRHFRLKGMCANGANAGNIQFQWCQNTTDATNTTVKANSTLKAWSLT